MKKSFYIILTLFSFCYTTFSAENESLEKYRAGNIYEKIDAYAFPQLQSSQDCYQLGLSLMQSEINFWKDTQSNLLEENQRLRVIVKLLVPHQEKKLSLSNFKEKLANLELRAKILINPNDPSDTINKDLFDIYTSYSTIINDLESILSVYENHKCSDATSSLQNQQKSLMQIRGNLLKKSQEIEKNNFLKRGLIQNNISGMGIPQICYSQKDQFQSKLPDMFGKYAFCDVEYVTQLFIPIIAQLFDTTQETLQQLHKMQEPKVELNSKARKKKKTTSHRFNAPSQQLSAPTAQIIEPEPVSVIQAQSDVSFSEAQQAVEKKILDAPPQEDLDQSTLNVLSERNVDTQLFISSFNLPIEPKLEPKPADIVPEILSIQEASPDAIYNMRPWEEFQKQESVEKKYLKPELPKALAFPLIFKLEEEYAVTARILLGLVNGSQEKVTMSAYQQLVTVGLRGAVFDRKKCVYFMARSIITQQWCSVAMHRLHQDDAHIIPHGTRYWKIARQLLLDAGLDKNNL
ncbi:MAG: hypothetical protein ACOH2E_00540 [Candidatus Paracaedibacter sp.]